MCARGRVCHQGGGGRVFTHQRECVTNASALLPRVDLPWHTNQSLVGERERASHIYRHVCSARCRLGVLSANGRSRGREAIAQCVEEEQTWKHVESTHTRAAISMPPTRLVRNTTARRTEQAKQRPIQQDGLPLSNCVCPRLKVCVCAARRSRCMLCDGWLLL
jgi:hypothetical protein